MLDENGKCIGKPLRSSLFGKSYGIDGLEKHYAKSTETIKSEGLAARTRTLVSASLASASGGDDFRTKLREQGIDLVLRHNDGGRLVGADYIDSTVLNGSVLGKEFSANKLVGRFADFAQGETRGKDMNAPTVAATLQPDTVPQLSTPTSSDRIGNNTLMQAEPDQRANQPTSQKKKIILLVGKSWADYFLSSLLKSIQMTTNRYPNPAKDKTKIREADVDMGDTLSLNLLIKASKLFN